MNYRKNTAIKKQGILTTLCCLLLCLSSIGTAYAAPEWPTSDTGIEALSGIVIDADSGAVLYEKDADTLYPPASTAKLLTALVTLDHCDNLDDIITFSREAVNRVESDSGNKISVVEGDKLTVKDCLYALLLYSSNQAANALAEYTAGDIDIFVQMMNDKVTELGLTSSHFDNPSGLNGDTQNVTSRELALIARAAFANPQLLEISTTITYKLPAMENNPDGLTITNEHRLVKTTDETSPYYYPPAAAGKTGYLLKAGNTLVTYAEQDGKRLISVVLKGQARQYFVDAKNMLQFGFANFDNYKISQYDQTDLSENELHSLSEKGIDTSDLAVSDDAVITLPKGAVFQDAQKNYSMTLPARHPEGAVAVWEYSYQNRIVGQAYISHINNQTMVSTIPETTADQAADPTGGEEDPADGLAGTEAGGKKINLVVIIVFIIVIIVGALIGLVYFYKRREARMLQERRRNRRARLQELGISQEEFEQMVESRKQRRGNQENKRRK